MPVPIVLDTDIGDDIDDMYALYLALLHPELELRAVTTAHRSSQRKARFVAKALRIAGVTDIPSAPDRPLSEPEVLDKRIQTPAKWEATCSGWRTRTRRRPGCFREPRT